MLRISERRAARAQPIRLHIVPHQKNRSLELSALSLLHGVQTGEIVAFCGAIIWSDGKNSIMRGGKQTRASMVYGLERAKLALMDMLEGDEP